MSIEKIALHGDHAQRITYFDFLRGVAILMVVAIHTFPGDTTYDNPGGVLTVVIRQILNCAVPIFLAISGFFLGRKSFPTFRTQFQFWKRQIPRIYIPCLIWSVPLFVLAVLRSSHSIVIDVAMLFFCGFSVYYFIALIIQYYLLLPSLNRLRKLRGGGFLLLTGFISSICILIVTYSIAIRGTEFPLLIYAGPFPLWIFFFALGVYLSDKKRTYSVKLLIPAVIIGLLLQYLESQYLYQFHGTGYGIKLSAFIYSSIVILLLFSKQMETWYNKRAT